MDPVELLDNIAFDLERQASRLDAEAKRITREASEVRSRAKAARREGHAMRLAAVPDGVVPWSLLMDARYSTQESFDRLEREVKALGTSLAWGTDESMHQWCIDLPLDRDEDSIERSLSIIDAVMPAPDSGETGEHVFVVQVVAPVTWKTEYRRIAVDRVDRHCVMGGRDYPDAASALTELSTAMRPVASEEDEAVASPGL